MQPRRSDQDQRKDLGGFGQCERRNGKLYNHHGGRREPALMTDTGARAVVGKDWCDERTASRLFAEFATRYADLAEHLW